MRRNSTKIIIKFISYILQYHIDCKSSCKRDPRINRAASLVDFSGYLNVRVN